MYNFCYSQSFVHNFFSFFIWIISISNNKTEWFSNFPYFTKQKFKLQDFILSNDIPNFIPTKVFSFSPNQDLIFFLQTKKNTKKNGKKEIIGYQICGWANEVTASSQSSLPLPPQRLLCNLQIQPHNNILYFINNYLFSLILKQVIKNYIINSKP